MDAVWIGVTRPHAGRPKGRLLTRDRPIKNIVLVIIGIVIGYAISGVMPMIDLKASLLKMETPDMSGGHELNTEAGSKDGEAKKE